MSNFQILDIEDINESVVGFQPAIHADFCIAALETYAYARREPVVIDLLTFVAAAEYADRSIKRNSLSWPRQISLKVPVYELSRWNSNAVHQSLMQMLTFLTGDRWTVSFEQRPGTPLQKPQDTFPFETELKSVMAYSDGLDSRSVAHLYAPNPKELMRVRVGSRANSGTRENGKVLPFTGIPYELNLPKRNREMSARTRGLKFAITGGIAAYLLDIQTVVVPESGQGIFGPALIPVGSSYADYRNHPLFTVKVESFLKNLLNHEVKYVFPRIWNTKSETLRAYIGSGKDDWKETWSCWRDQRRSSVNGKRRHCGVCAACLLRRMSVFCAGAEEHHGRYICERLDLPSLEECIAQGFKHYGKAFYEYAVAGTLQMEHFALEGDSSNESKLRRHATMVGSALNLAPEEVMQNLTNLIERHSKEWNSFLDSSGSNSFLCHWVRRYE